MLLTLKHCCIAGVFIIIAKWLDKTYSRQLIGRKIFKKIGLILQVLFALCTALLITFVINERLVVELKQFVGVIPAIIVDPNGVVPTPGIPFPGNPVVTKPVSDRWIRQRRK